MSAVEVLETLGSVFSNSAFTALLGAISGGLLANRTAKSTQKSASNSAALEKLNGIRNSLILIRIELDSAWNLYQKEFAPELMTLPEGHAYMTNWSIGKGTFIIYDSMPQFLAEISSNVSGKVVQIYMRIKGLVSMIELNNSYFDIANRSKVHYIDSVMESKKVQNQEISVDFSERLSASAGALMEWEGVKLGMGELADALKALTTELASSYEEVMTGIDYEVESIDKKIAKFPKN